MAQQFRQEKDSIGIKEIPAEVYYGVQTARAVENYPISGMRANPTLIRAIGMVKYAAAQANKELGLVDDKSADAIMQAAKEVVDGKWDASFVVDVFQAGAGVSFHMNSNEVIANRATELMGGKLGEYTVHPNDHVNYGQSTNDVFPTSMRVATLLELEKLYPVLEALAAAYEAKGKEFHGIMKSGRTHMQDAVPIRLGQEFAAYGVATRKAIAIFAMPVIRCASLDSAAPPLAPASTLIPTIALKQWLTWRKSLGRNSLPPPICAGPCNRTHAWRRFHRRCATLPWK